MFVFPAVAEESFAFIVENMGNLPLKRTRKTTVTERK